MSQATPRETAAVFISRLIRNGEYISLGTNLPVPTAGVLLAHLTYAPDLKLNVMNYFTNLSGIARFDDLNQVASPKVGKWAEAIMSLEQMFDAVVHMDLCFAGGMQIDRYGNANLLGVGDGPGGWKVRGPGAVGTASVMAGVKRFILYTNDHSPRTLVERCQYVTAVGWDTGGADARRRLGLKGGGPVWCITPRAAFDFHPDTKEMRLRHLFSGTVDEAVTQMGFRPVIAPDLSPAPAPTAEELAVLRTRVDPAGLLRR